MAGRRQRSRVRPVTDDPSFEQAYQSHYENVFNREDAIQFFSSLLAPHLPGDKTVSILDIGCGSGLGLCAIDGLGYKDIQGIDINALQVESSRQRGLQVHHVSETSAWLTSTEKRFDFVIATDVLEHMDAQERQHVMKGINDILTVGGRFLCTVPNANSALASRWRYIDLTHQTSFTESSLRTLFFAGGFTSVDIRGSDPFLIFDTPRAQFKRGLSWGLRKAVRAFRRMEMVGELGPDEGLKIPLSVNLMAIAQKR